MIKRICSCGKVFKTDTHESKCPNCKVFNEARCSKPIAERRNQPNEIHFLFFDNDGMYTRTLGSYIILKKDIKKTAIWIYLFNFRQFYNESEKIKQLITCISHEFLHLGIYQNEGVDVSKKADDWLMTQLEKEGYL
ncbi:MAG TPA: hypothetical protein VMY59_01015 [Candidatus Thermoplasmatota archaeon]|nr:hypothetical protein [Candidatus Thermoplasmatota archaeon]